MAPNRILTLGDSMDTLQVLHSSSAELDQEGVDVVHAMLQQQHQELPRSPKAMEMVFFEQEKASHHLIAVAEPCCKR